MSQPVWTLIPKLKPDHQEDHDRFVAEREAAKGDLRKIGFVARLLPGPGKKRRELQAKLLHIDRQLAACYMHIGADLNPPRINRDAKATKWYLEYLNEDPEAWPLPPEEMVEEMDGLPVWELSGHKVLQNLEVGWPKQPYPVPAYPWLSVDCERRVVRSLTAEETEDAAAALEEAIVKRFQSKHAELEAFELPRVIESIVRQKLPSGTKYAEDEMQEAFAVLSAVTWLRFWGRNGYGFKVGGTPSS